MTSRVTSTIPAGSPAEAPCTAIRVIGVRGSTEPQQGSRLLAPIGDTVARAFPGRVSYSELEYPATIKRFLPHADIDAAGIDRLFRLGDLAGCQAISSEPIW